MTIDMMTFPENFRFVELVEGSKRPKEKLKDGGRPLSEIDPDAEGIGLLIPQGFTLFDFDNKEDGKKVLNYLNSQSLAYVGIETGRGIHIYMKTPETLGCPTGVWLRLGVKADIKSFDRNAFGIVKLGGKWRKATDPSAPWDKADFAPETLYPLKNQTLFEKYKFTKGTRNDDFFNYSFDLGRVEKIKDPETIKEICHVMNEFILDDPVSRKELDTILRDDALEGAIELAQNATPWLVVKVGPRGGRKEIFSHEVLAKHIVEQEKIILGGGNNYYTYDDGYYKLLPERSDMDHLIVKYYPAITIGQRNNTQMAMNFYITEKMQNMKDDPDHRDPYVVNLKNGRLDLRTLELSPHSDEYFDFYQIPTDYVPFAKSDVLDTMLRNVFELDEQRIMLIEEMIGYCMMSHLKFRIAFFLVGDGANGKSTLINLIRDTFGFENCCAVSPHDFERRFATVQLHNRLINLADDIGSRRVMETGDFKKACSGDIIQVEQKGKPMFQIKPYATPIFAANEMPYFQDDSYGAKSRRIIIPFNAQFKPGSPNYDPTIGLKINTPEVRQALIWRGCEGAQRLMRNEKFTMPEACVSALKVFERENSNISMWIYERDITADNFIGNTTGQMHQEFRTYCKEIGTKNVNSIQSFGRTILKEFPELEKGSNNGEKVYKYKE